MPPQWKRKEQGLLSRDTPPFILITKKSSYAVDVNRLQRTAVSDSSHLEIKNL